MARRNCRRVRGGTAQICKSAGFAGELPSVHAGVVPHWPMGRMNWFLAIAYVHGVVATTGKDLKSYFCFDMFDIRTVVETAQRTL
jgi:hypothetical protein